MTHAEVDNRMVVRPGGAKLRMQYCSSNGLSVSEDLHESSVDACQHGIDEENVCTRCRLQVGQLLPQNADRRQQEAHEHLSFRL